MKIALEVKNNSKIIKPSKNNVIIYDGKQWYVTTKEELFEDFYKVLDKMQDALEKLKQENASFKSDVSSQILEITNIVENVYKDR